MNAASPPKVSVVIPNYNHARFLHRRIESVLRQTFQDFELILLDDCSTDESRSILNSYADDPRVRLEFNSVRSSSPFKQWNKGVKLAGGEFVWIAESDDYADEQILERLMTVFETDPKTVFAYCRSWRVRADDQRDGFADDYLINLDPHRWTMDYCADGRDECREFLVQHNTVPNASAVVFRRAAYQQVGGADESLRLCADWKLWAALALSGRIAYLGEPLNYFRFHDASVRTTVEPVTRDVTEPLRVIRWIQEQVTVESSVTERVCERLSFYWVPAILSKHVPLAVKSSILRDVNAIDPHILRRIVKPALMTLRLKFERHCSFARRKS